jgi:hypothetical protein
MDAWTQWATEVFGGAALGDVRRSRRLVQMAAQAGRRPQGRVSAVFQDDAERQGAYDFIESEHVSADAIRGAVTVATARRCSKEPWVLVPVDGTSLKLWDGTGRKDFGAIGTYTNGASGLKLYNAIAVSRTGVPLGVAAQIWWRRPRKKREMRHHRARTANQKETGHLLESIDQVCRDFAEHAPRTHCWFQLDRGGDSQLVLKHLEATGHWFTIRAHADRRVVAHHRQPRYLRETLRQQPVLGHFTADLAATAERPARTARFALRAARVTLVLKNKWTRRCSEISVTAVSVRETRNHGHAVDWVLLTNRNVERLEDARQVVEGYTMRWRIEEFHKTWKTGACDVENTQLHCSDRVIKWATILAAVAARIERLKYLSRNEPDAPATTELEPHEVQALVLLRKERRNKHEKIPKRLSISLATQWIAELGGYTGKSSGGPPGTITIARGLEYLRPAAELLRIMEKKR